MVLEVTADLPFNGASLMIAGTPATAGIGEFAAFLDALEQGFARGGGGENEGHAGGDGGLDVSKRPGPLDFAKRGVYHDHLLGRDEARELQRHGLGVFPAAVADGEERAPFEQPVDGALLGGVGVGGSGNGHQRASRALATTALMVSGLASVAAPQPRRFRSRSSQSPMSWL